MVLILQSSSSDEPRTFDQPQVVVGREPTSDLVLPRGTVSKVHALIALLDGCWRVRDAGSTNGTRVQGREAVDWIPIRAGMELGFGPDERWRVVACPAPRVDGPLDPTVRADFGQVRLLVWSRSGEEGGARVYGRNGPVDVHTSGNRFKVLYVLAAQSARSRELDDAWIDDDLLRARIWTRVGARERTTNALNVLLSYTRRLLADAGLDGDAVEKGRLRTRFRLAGSQVRVVEADEYDGP